MWNVKILVNVSGLELVFDPQIGQILSATTSTMNFVMDQVATITERVGPDASQSLQTPARSRTSSFMNVLPSARRSTGTGRSVKLETAQYVSFIPVLFLILA